MLPLVYTTAAKRLKSPFSSKKSVDSFWMASSMASKSRMSSDLHSSTHSLFLWGGYSLSIKKYAHPLFHIPNMPMIVSMVRPAIMATHFPGSTPEFTIDLATALLFSSSSR